MTQKNSERHWVTRGDLVALLDLSESGIDKIRRALGNAHERTEGKAVRIYAPGWLKEWARYTSGVLDDEGEVDDPGADSPWLEEGRKWKAKRERAKYEQESGRLVSFDTIVQAFSLVARHYRKAGEEACERCQHLIEDALDDAEQEVDSQFGDCSSEDNDEGPANAGGAASAD